MGGFGKDPIPGFRGPARAPSPRPADAPETVRLRVLNGPCAGRAFEFVGARCRVGRGDPPAVTVDVDLGECELGSPAMVSRLHAELIWIEGKLHIVDLGSRNGTWVGDRPVVALEGGASDPSPLAAGSRIRLANLELEVLGPTGASVNL